MTTLLPTLGFSLPLLTRRKVSVASIIHTCTPSLPSILTPRGPCAHVFWNCLMCASPYIPFCRPRPGAEECFIQVIPTKVPTSISSSSVPTVSPNAPRPHPIPFPKTYSPHRRALSYAFMSRLCRTSMRLCFSIVRGAADFEQQRSSITWRAAALVIACARARSCRGLWHTGLPACA